MTGSKTLDIFVAGLVTIGLVTALVLPGRQTASVIKASGNAGSGLLNSAIKG